MDVSRQCTGIGKKGYTEMSQDLDELYGESGYSDYRIGDTIRFREAGQIMSGEILHIAAPSQTPVSKKPVPTSLQVDCSDGFPHIVYASDIVEES